MIILEQRNCISKTVDVTSVESNNSYFQIKEIIIPGLLTFCLLMLLFWMKGLAPFGTKSLVVADANIQYLDFFLYLKSILDGENSIGYSFSKTLGGPNIAVFSYYLSSPFNLLIVFFNRLQIHAFFDLVVALKLSLASMTFAYFGVKRFERSSKECAIVFSLIAVGYGLSQYNIAQSSNIMWLDGVYMLPLIMLQISNIVNGQKAYALPLFVGMAIIFNWYSAGIDCIYSALWFVFEYALYGIDKKFDVKHFIRCFGKYLTGVISGVMLSAVLFLPTIGALRKSARGALHLSDLLDFSVKGGLSYVLPKYTYGANSEYGSVALFCGSLAIVLALFAIFNNTVSRRKCALLAGLFVVSILIFYWHPLFLLFSLLTNASSYYYRYSYVAIFSILFLAMVGANEMNGRLQAKKLVKIAVVFSLLLIIFRYFKEVNDAKYVYATAIMIVLETALFIRVKIKPQNKLFAGVFAVVFAMVGITDLATNTSLLLNSHSMNKVSHNNAYIETQEKTISSIKAADHSAYRISQTTTRNMNKNNLTAYYNDALAYNYASISGYTSSPDDVTRNFLKNLGYRINGQNMCITNTSILGADSLLGVKYVLSPFGIQGLTQISDSDNNGKSVYLNPYAFPMAFVYKDTGYTAENTANPFVYQNELYKQLFGISEDLYYPISYDLTKGKNNRGAKILLHVPNKSNIAVYGNIPWKKEANSSIYINGSFATKYACWLSPAVFYVPHTDGQICEVKVKSDKDNFDWNSVQFYALNLDVLEKCADMSNARAVESMSLENGHVELHVKAAENERLFVSIPSDKDWDITINGGAAEIELVGDCLYSIRLNPGLNDVTMIYHIRYLKLGLFVTVFTLICYVGYMYYEKTRKKI